MDHVPEDMKNFLEIVDQAYRAADEDRGLMERSMDLVSKELLQRNDELSRQVQETQRVIEALQESESKLLAALEKVQELNAARANFINAAAHELGTPLTPLKLQVQVVKDRLDERSDSKQRHSVEILERNVDRLMMLVRDLTDSAKLQTDRFDVQEEELDLSTLIAAEVSTFQSLAQEVLVTLTMDAPDFMPAWGDPNRVSQVLDNLLSNALKFTPAKGNVHVTVDKVDGFARVRVQDDGIGISEENMEKLFLPFSQIHAHGRTTRFAGTGLGLYICRGIIERSGGQIDVQSDGKDKGSTFWFTLPLDRATDPVDEPSG